MADIVQFEAGQPVEVALKFPEPKLYDGQYGERAMFSLTDGRVMYLDLLTAARIKSLGVQPGEFFFVLKSKKGRSTEWSVFREGGAPGPAPARKSVPPHVLANSLVDRVAARNAAGRLEQDLAASIEMVERRKAGEQRDGTFAVLAPPVAPKPPAAAPQAIDRSKTKLEDALKTVVAAVHAAQEYARAIGFEEMPVFTSEDIRTMANTLVIQDAGGKRNAA